jgi:hypothetical protein
MALAKASAIKNDDVQITYCTVYSTNQSLIEQFLPFKFEGTKTEVHHDWQTTSDDSFMICFFEFLCLHHVRMSYHSRYGELSTLDTSIHMQNASLQSKVIL